MIDPVAAYQVVSNVPEKDLPTLYKMMGVAPVEKKKKVVKKPEPCHTKAYLIEFINRNRK